ncbi:MAG: glycosyltransferase family 1 protein [bacterium]|nr:glycosyltransferase family 1 protein [bacterium]
MRIGINLLSESTKSMGPRVYAENLIKWLAKFDSKNEYYIFLSKGNFKNYYVSKKNFKFISIGVPNTNPIIRRLMEQLLVPLLAQKYKIDLCHSINNVMPIFFQTNSILTIHDVTSFVLGKRFSKLKIFFLKKLVPYSAKLAKKIITVSNSSKEEIIKYCSVNGWKIKVIYNGVSNIFNLETGGCEKWEKYKPYILYVGTIEPGKNVISIIDAFYKIQRIHQEYKLILAGRKGWLYHNVLRRVFELSLNDKVIFIEKIDKNYLPSLYRCADVFIFPSFHEGFGLPILEAMACGTPVITSNTSALSEVAGNAAVLVDPYNVKDIVDAIQKVLTCTQFREELVAKGLERIKLFSWEKCAKETLKVYEEVYNEK